MNKWNTVCILTLLGIAMVFFSGCTAPGPAGTAPAAPSMTQTISEPLPETTTPPAAIASPPVSSPGPAAARTQKAIEPILGSWTNGLVFHADGTVGSDGNTAWKANRYQNYSYFVITDLPSPGSSNQRNVTSTEWLYNPYSDKIYMRGSSESFGRQIPSPEPSPGIPGTEVRTPATPVPTTSATVAATTAVPTVNSTVTATTTVPTTIAPVTTKTAMPTSCVTVVTTMAIPTIRPLVTTTTALPKTMVETTAVFLPSDDGTGTLLIRTGGLGIDATVSVSREGDTAGVLRIPVLPDGNSNIVSLPAGNYIAYLPGKYGGDPEQQAFSINANCNTVISFSAYSYRASSGGGCGG